MSQIFRSVLQLKLSIRDMQHNNIRTGKNEMLMSTKIEFYKRTQ